MPPSQQLSLSVELTRLVPLQPLASIATAGILDLARRLQKTGSDLVLEEDLATIFGRSRIEPRFESSFRAVVVQQPSTAFNKYINIVLDKGAGPTVQRTLRKDVDEIYFSMVVQLSLLCSAFKVEDLTKGLQQALARRAENISSDTPYIPAFDRLLGTLTAIRDQTSAFNWRLILDAVHENTFPLKPVRKLYLPVAILQGCVDVFAIVQRFPDDRLARILVTDQATAEFLVVWSHHVLGLSVIVCDFDGVVSAKFGTGPENVNIVLLKDSYERSEICLLDGSKEVVFRLSEQTEDQDIMGELRAKSGGFGTRYLEITKPWAAVDYHHLAIQNAMKTCRAWFSTAEYSTAHPACNFEYRLLCAAKFLFPNLSGSLPEKDAATILPQFKPDGITELTMSQLLFTFSCVSSLDGLEDLPLAIDALTKLGEPGKFPNLLLANFEKPFAYMKMLLLGTEDVQDAVLVSSHGWSVYTNVLTLPDPSETSLPIFHVAYGVPSLGGEQKRYILDAIAPSKGSITPTSAPETQLQDTEPILACAFDIPRPRWFVGTTSVAFELLLTFDLKPRRLNGVGPEIPLKRIRTGLLNLDRSALQARRVPACQHQEVSLGTKLHIPDDCQTFSSTCDFRAEKDCPWIFIALSAGSRQARWFCLLDALAQGFLKPSLHGNNYCKLLGVYIRDRGTCPECAINYLREDNRSSKSEPVEGQYGFAILIL